MYEILISIKSNENENLYQERSELYPHCVPTTYFFLLLHIGNTKLKFRRMEKSFSFDWICVVYINFGEKVSVSV